MKELNLDTNYFEGGLQPLPDQGGNKDGGENRVKVDKVFDFLMKIPPDWDMAEKHGRTNLCINAAKTTLDLQKPETYCPCCQMPYPEDEHFFSIWDENEELGDLGEGFPVFFYLIKYITWLLVVLCVVYFLPMVVMMAKAFKEADMGPKDANLSYFSFGVFLKSGQSKADEIEIVAGLMMMAIFVTLIGSIILRRRLLMKAISVDTNATTPSDFALLGYCPYFDDDNDFSKEKVEEEVTAYFKFEYGINEIEYVNIVFDIHDIYDITAELEENLKKRSLVESFMQEQGLSRDNYKNITPSDYDGWPTEGGFCSSTYLDLDQIEFNIEQSKSKLDKLTNDSAIL